MKRQHSLEARHRNHTKSTSGQRAALITSPQATLKLLYTSKVTNQTKQTNKKSHKKRILVCILYPLLIMNVQSGSCLFCRYILYFTRGLILNTPGTVRQILCRPKELKKESLLISLPSHPQGRIWSFGGCRPQMPYAYPKGLI